ncbi:origin binding protein [Proboscivirus elephantidbeta4]|uniref:Replication origin-binding protein n=6 Tax=Elephant endotheliotropic herpesvirus 4 TaxID=548914 RepID=A0A0S1TQQ5_9BETA|nr:origin binding protein [Elephant endotheliotropic herpesvirus 4]ALM26021.1 origin binding protein [Elephant endotheliotropic herpesvirus 4]
MDDVDCWSGEEDEEDDVPMSSDMEVDGDSGGGRSIDYGMSCFSRDGSLDSGDFERGAFDGFNNNDSVEDDVAVWSDESRHGGDADATSYRYANAEAVNNESAGGPRSGESSARTGGGNDNANDHGVDEKRLECTRLFTEWFGLDLASRYGGDSGSRVRTVLQPDSPVSVNNVNSRVKIIRAPMGSGKTAAMISWLRTVDMDRARVLVISCRRSFAEELLDKFRRAGVGDFVLYTDVDGYSLTGNHIIVQIESLYRLEGSYDVVILDEVVSVVNQFYSSTMRHLDEVDAKFLACVASCRHLLLMDATINGPLIEFFVGLRGADDGPATLILNSYVGNNFARRRAVFMSRFTTPAVAHDDDEYRDRCGRGDAAAAVVVVDSFMDALLCAILDGKRVCVFASTASAACFIVEEIRNRFPEKRILRMTGRDRLENCDRWDSYDVVVYNTVVTVGVSFEKIHFHSLFVYVHLFRNGPDIMSVYQSMGRVRHLIDNRMYIYVNPIMVKKNTIDGHLSLFPCLSEACDLMDLNVITRSVNEFKVKCLSSSFPTAAPRSSSSSEDNNNNNNNDLNGQADQKQRGRIVTADDGRRSRIGKEGGDRGGARKFPRSLVRNTFRVKYMLEKTVLNNFSDSLTLLYVLLKNNRISVAIYDGAAAARDANNNDNGNVGAVGGGGGVLLRGGSEGEEEENDDGDEIPAESFLDFVRSTVMECRPLKQAGAQHFSAVPYHPEFVRTVGLITDCVFSPETPIHTVTEIVKSLRFESSKHAFVNTVCCHAVCRGASDEVFAKTYEAVCGLTVPSDESSCDYTYSLGDGCLMYDADFALDMARLGRDVVSDLGLRSCTDAGTDVPEAGLVACGVRRGAGILRCLQCAFNTHIQCFESLSPKTLRLYNALKGISPSMLSMREYCVIVIKTWFKLLYNMNLVRCAPRYVSETRSSRLTKAQLEAELDRRGIDRRGCRTHRQLRDLLRTSADLRRPVTITYKLRGQDLCFLFSSRVGSDAWADTYGTTGYRGGDDDDKNNNGDTVGDTDDPVDRRLSADFSKYDGGVTTIDAGEKILSKYDGAVTTTVTRDPSEGGDDDEQEEDVFSDISRGFSGGLPVSSPEEYYDENHRRHFHLSSSSSSSSSLSSSSLSVSSPPPYPYLETISDTWIEDIGGSYAYHDRQYDQHQQHAVDHPEDHHAGHGHG